MNFFAPFVKTSLDFITVGRAGWDLYANQENKDFKNITSFTLGVGGAPANVAVGLAKLGHKVGMISKVSHDGIGEHIINYFKKKKINTQAILQDNRLKTSLVVTEIKPQNGKVVFYREDPCDLNIRKEEIKESYLKKSKAVIISGTGLAKEPSRGAILKVIHLSQKNNLKVIFDLDFRPFHWKNRVETAFYYQKVSQLSDLVIGNLEEFKIIFNRLDWKKASKKVFANFFQKKTQLVVLKNGRKGAKIFSQELDQKIFIQPFPIKIKKPFGAGDAFLASFCSFLLKEKSLKKAGLMASASAALVVMKKTCSEAMPSLQEINFFIKKLKKKI